MRLIFQEITTKKEWEKIILQFHETNFLQSFQWGKFQEKINKKVFRIAAFEKNNKKNLKYAFQIVKETARRGNYLAIAGGPLLDWKKISNSNLKELIKFLKKTAKKEQCSFIRFRPQTLDTSNLRSNLKQLGSIPSPMHLTADLTLQLDLTKDIETILKEMRKNTRYEIRQIEKKNISVTQSQNPEDIRAFFEQQLALAKKHHFVPFSYKFLLEQFKTFAEDNNVILFSSFQGKKLLASAFIIFYNKEAVYHYGISTADNYRLPGSYACQWAAIQEAKKRDCTKYNFWGIAPKEDQEHRFAGVSLFKRGFGGQEIAYLPAYDIPTSFWYWGIYLFEIVRKKLRKL